MFYRDEYDASGERPSSSAAVSGRANAPPGAVYDDELSSEDAVIAQKMERMKMAAQRRPGSARPNALRVQTPVLPPPSSSSAAQQGQSGLFSPSRSGLQSQSQSQSQSAGQMGGRSLAEEFAAEQARHLAPSQRAQAASSSFSASSSGSGAGMLQFQSPSDDEESNDIDGVQDIHDATGSGSLKAMASNANNNNNNNKDLPVGPAPLMTPSSRSSSSAVRASAFAAAEVKLDLSGNRAEALFGPAPKGGRVQCYVRRIKGGLKKWRPQYYMYMQDGDAFLLAAKKRGGNKTASYLVSLSQDALARDSEHYFGKLRSNFLGTEFRLYDNGENPEKGKKGLARRDLGIVLYEPNLLGNKGPRRMTVVVPQAEVEVRPRTEKDSIYERFKQARLEDLACLRNKEPVWNDHLKAYVLNFGGRVTMASVKNFQLIDADRPSDVIMQFGKVDENTFTLDFANPLSALQAFLIALSSFDHKLACE
eukprot:ANDGO_00449.mRNA.1 Tubby protein homolog 1